MLPPQLIVAFRMGATAALRTTLKKLEKVLLLPSDLNTSNTVAWGKKERAHLLMIWLC